jgi:hypothetical protein
LSLAPKPMTLLAIFNVRFDHTSVLTKPQVAL